jgi:phenylalanyl-tRNA synthetase beta chain
MAVASRLLVELCGAWLVPGTLDVAEPIPARPPIRLRHARADALLGVSVDPQESAAILERLGATVDRGADAHEVTVPFERGGDLTREIDLIEEVGRVHGLDRIPALLPRTTAQGGRTPDQARVERLRRLAADLGLHETVSYRFVPEADADRLLLPPDDPRRQVVRLANPMSEEMAVMRRSLLPGLLRAVALNEAHQRPDGGLFEVGRTYAPRPDGLADEREWLVAVLFGARGEDHWREGRRPVDLYTATGLAAGLARGVRVGLELVPASNPYGHPARQAELRAGGRKVGWAGEMHPLVLRAFDVRGPVAALGLDLAELLAVVPGVPQYEDLLTVPASTRDLALIVGAEVPAAEVVAVARDAGRPLVRDARVFDRYAGAQVPEGKVSLAVRLTLADPGRTLTDAEMDAQVEAVVAALGDRLDARLRA